MTQEPITILCIDNDGIVLKLLKDTLSKDSFHVHTATTGEEGLALLKRTENVGLILSNQNMPKMSGVAFLQAAGEFLPDTTRMMLSTHSDATIAIEAINQGGVHRFFVKPWNDQELLQAIHDGIKRYQMIKENKRLAELVVKERDELAEWNTNLKKRLLQQTAQIRKQMAEARPQNEVSPKVGEVIISRFADLQDQCCGRISKHSRTVAALAETMAATMKLSTFQCEEIKNAALLHDIGKVGLPDRLLSRGCDVMNVDDLKEYRTHAVRGQIVIDKVEELRGVAACIRHHHETFDGKGFPDGLMGERIPLGSRIIALANCAENTFSRETGPGAKYVVTKMIASEMGRLFDPALASAANIAVMQVLR